jgi:hypothetical protein
VEALGESIAELAAQISAATYELLVMLRDFDEQGGWNGGFRSCAHWLNWRAGIDLGAAREKVRVARALAALPRLSESMRRGEISYAKVRALTRIATPVTEEELLHFARAGTASHVEKLVRSMRLVDRIEARQREERRHEGRFLRAYTDEDGMVVVAARLAPEAGAALLRALDAGVERLYGLRRERESAAPAGAPAGQGVGMAAAAGETTAEQRRADALGLMAESALTAGLDPGTRGDRYQVVVHVDAEALAKGGGDVSAETRGGGRRAATSTVEAGDVSAETCSARDVSAETCGGEPQSSGAPRAGYLAAETSGPEPERGTGNCTLDGTRVSAETCRRLACDAALVVMRHAPDSSVLDVGRRTRAISPALRRALDHRDGGCRFPGCGLRLCDAHHVEHWADGGETKLGNTLLLCRRHHRAVHEEGFSVELLANGEARFWRPDGRRLVEAPPLPAVLAEPLATVVARVARGGVTVEAASTLPTWNGGQCDYAAAIEWLRAVRSPGSSRDV